MEWCLTAEYFTKTVASETASVETLLSHKCAHRKHKDMSHPVNMDGLHLNKKKETRTCEHQRWNFRTTWQLAAMVYGNDLETLQCQCLLVLHAVVMDALQTSLPMLNDEINADLPNQFPFFKNIWSHKCLETRNGSSDTGLVVKQTKNIGNVNTNKCAGISAPSPRQIASRTDQWFQIRKMRIRPAAQT